ncbi:MAG: hypothetical protein NXY59_04715 [Aigarchaeota archaeon]|nr:hypothetical protein [Candidatus Pelearchaeum maunauluense]
MNERDRTRYLYFASVSRLAFAWLMASLIFGMLMPFMPRLYLAFRDAFIHALAVGFIAHIITAYAPILMPGLLSRRMPYRGLSITPAYLISVGNI